MKTLFRHAGIIVNDVEKLKNFYTKNFKLKILCDIVEEGKYFSSLIGKKKSVAKVVKLGLHDDSYLEFIQFLEKKSKKKTRLNKDFKQKGKIHICFTVKNIETIFKKLRKEKIKFISKPLHSDFDPVKTCFFYDPEDNLIQLVEGKNSF